MQQKESKIYENASIKAIQRSKDDGSKVERLEMHEEDLDVEENMEKTRKKAIISFLVSNRYQNEELENKFDDGLYFDKGSGLSKIRMQNSNTSLGL